MTAPASNQPARSDVSYYSPARYTLTTTASGPWVAQAVSIEANLYDGGLVTLKLPQTLAATTVAISLISVAAPLPAIFRPTSTQQMPIRLVSNGLEVMGSIIVTTIGTLIVSLDGGGNFAGSSGLRGTTIAYQK